MCRAVHAGEARRHGGSVVAEEMGHLDKFGKPSDGYTAVAFTMRLTETYHFWTKNNPANVELIPEPFAEINDQMAKDLGISAGDYVRVSSARGAHICRAMVTKRLSLGSIPCGTKSSR